MAKCAARLASKPSLLHLLSNALAAVRADLNAVRMFPDFFGDQLLRLKRLITQDADHFHDDSVLSVQMVTARICLWQIKLVWKKRRKTPFSSSDSSRVKRMRKWFWSR
ncbi:hypothetical protein EDC32_103238 [Laceyella sacchari]|nr:hypothetical protein EDC32_103238 [Laceyella sacchari]